MKKNPGINIDDRKTPKKQNLYPQLSQERVPKFQKTVDIIHTYIHFGFVCRLS